MAPAARLQNIELNCGGNLRLDASLGSHDSFMGFHEGIFDHEDAFASFAYGASRHTMSGVQRKALAMSRIQEFDMLVQLHS